MKYKIFADDTSIFSVMNDNMEDTKRRSESHILMGLYVENIIYSRSLKSS